MKRSVIKKEKVYSFPQQKDKAFEDAMLKQYDNLIKLIAGKWINLMPFEDAYQYGVIGLLYACRWWDEKSNVPFRKTAALCIRSHIAVYYRRYEMPIKRGRKDGLDSLICLRDTDRDDEFKQYEEEKPNMFLEWLNSHLTDEEMDILVFESDEYMSYYGVSLFEYKKRRSMVRKKIKEIGNGMTRVELGRLFAGQEDNLKDN